MKKLSELKISPAPWKVVPYGISTEDKHPTIGDVFDATGESITIDLPTYRDACMMGSAPDMYQALRFQCFGDTGVGNCRNCKGSELGNCPTCPLGNARAALAKASGESEVE